MRRFIQVFSFIQLRMSSQGRLSEILGEKALDIDKYIRNLAYLESAQRIVDNLDSDVKDHL